MNKLKLGVIGMSEGNGHPYSWSAIFNGFNPKYMKDCPFPVIPEYLAKEKYPENFLGDSAQVTHVWTQDLEISNHIAKASNIPFVVERTDDMIGQVDAVLLARDDADNHKAMAEPFIKAGLPIFIDKPFALSLADAEEMLGWQKYESQIFTCSSLRFAEELRITENEKEEIGEINIVEASVMKKWETYGVHLIEPLICNLSGRGELLKVQRNKIKENTTFSLHWENCEAVLTITGNKLSPLHFKYFGTKNTVEKQFYNSFACFRTSLEMFINQIQSKENIISREETLEIVKILEIGML